MKASPFNAVKLTLGVILVVGFLLMAVAGRFTASVPAQLLLLVSYGAIAAVWLVYRTRRVLHEQRVVTQSSQEKSSVNADFDK